VTSVEHTDVLEELKQIRRRLEVLEDAILSPNDKVALEQARKEFREGKTVNHKELVRKFL